MRVSSSPWPSRTRSSSARSRRPRPRAGRRARWTRRHAVARARRLARWPRVLQRAPRAPPPRGARGAGRAPRGRSRDRARAAAGSRRPRAAPAPRRGARAASRLGTAFVAAAATGGEGIGRAAPAGALGAAGRRQVDGERADLELGLRRRPRARPPTGTRRSTPAPSSAAPGLVLEQREQAPAAAPATWTVSTGRTKRRPRTPNQRPSTSRRSSPAHWKRSSSKPVCSGATVLISGCCPRSGP